MPTVKLGDVVERIKDKIDKDATDLEFYIGGEHFDYGEVVITKKAPLMGSTIGPAFHMHFMPDDVLLMSRNPHLRKAGMVDFEGICSDVSYVCRTKDENVLLQKYLPFVFQTDNFWEFAESNKKGSTNFFLNWSDFARYEFFLPDIEKQRELTDLLWAAADAKAAYQQLLEQTDELVKSQFIEMFGDPALNSKGLPIKNLLELGENLDNRRVPITSGDRVVGQYPYYGASGIVDYIENYIFDEDILLISEDGANLLARVTPIAFPASGKVWVNNHAHVMKFPNMATQCYVEHLLNMIDISNYVTGTAQPKLNQAKLNAIPIPTPSLDDQERYMQLIEQSDKSKFELKQAIDSTSGLIRALMQQDLSN